MIIKKCLHGISLPEKKNVGIRKKEKIKRRNERRLAGFGVSRKKAEEKIISIEECVHGIDNS